MLLNIVVYILIVIIIAAILLKLWHKLFSGRCMSTKKMDGKVVIVTGANTGIGKETALGLARRGARVVLACRDPKRGIQAREEIIEKTKNKGVYFLQLDLSSLKSVRDFVSEFKRREKKLHVLINNAAGAGLPNKKTSDGLQLEMHINHFGPFLLTMLLLDLLKQSSPSRIIMVSSIAHKFAKLEIDNINSEKWFSDTYMYSNTKLANVLFANELARRLKGTGVTCNSLHPGVVKTEIARRMPKIAFAIFNFILSISFKSAEEGAQTSIYLAVASELELTTGKYFVDCKESSMSELAKNEKFAKEVFDASIRYVKLSPKESKI